jgi:hypothetical protein
MLIVLSFLPCIWQLTSFCFSLAAHQAAGEEESKGEGLRQVACAGAKRVTIETAISLDNAINSGSDSSSSSSGAVPL